MVAVEFFQNLIASIPENFVILFEIGIIIIFASILAFILKLVKQPLIPAYVIAGILIGPLVFGIIQNQELIKSLSEIGVIFLIFVAGLEINFKKLKEVGHASTIAGVLQIVIMFAAGFFIALWLGLLGKIPIYIGLIVAFSSTMVVIKLLADKKELNSLHGRLIIGILLIQDIVAILALTILTTNFTLASILIALAKAGAFAVIALILSKVANPIFRASAKSAELLIVVSIAFLFLFTIGAYFANLSLIIGAFFAGVALANSDFKIEIVGKIMPIRDFFAVIFFVALGMQLIIISTDYIILFLILLGLVIILKPLVIMFLVRGFGYKKRTAFLTGNALAQTSEFSLIMIGLGIALGHLTDMGLVSVLILLTIVSMALTTYLIRYDKKLYSWLSFPLNLFNKIKSKKEDLEYIYEDGKKIVLFGCHRMGTLVLKRYEDKKKDIMVVDYNPEIIKALINKKIPCIYGDFINSEVLEKLNLENAEIIISTIPDAEDNLLLIKKIKQYNSKVPVIVVAERISEALMLYKEGADYVILPKVIGGQKAFEEIRKIRQNRTNIEKIKKAQLKYLNSIHRILY